ncbi:hypothetical protein A3F08_00855 [Candidatus Berkelbacteria bacterium RIFCSPHIGHO2_12_FULL_36_9]|uniref:PsbP C-terminal domain-containing protein n=1 Tax=Candidatus Berkelbacteria bacterium RIFCSPHIGHO2_12_FULL_36_9 TaxID=1797469 RepID=A0A1F5EIR1_9BACT|nr:MAG: hypothetical protein A3F08_00855 [Candidatus Berkelbacteria bacterium RIFCSPHIGHO2_12_FULL_36_9]
MKAIQPTFVKLIIAVIILAGLGIYFYYYQNGVNKSITSDDSVKFVELTPDVKNEEIEFKDDNYELSFKYPETWLEKDLEGEKNVTAPLTSETIGYLYDSANKKDEIGASIKLLRFVLEENKTINSSDEWFNYIMDKVNTFTAQTDLVKDLGYELISLEKVADINGRWVIREDYKRKNNIRGRDYYIYAGDLYQFVFKSLDSSFGQYSSIFDNIAKSFIIK